MPTQPTMSGVEKRIDKYCCGECNERSALFDVGLERQASAPATREFWMLAFA